MDLLLESIKTWYSDYKAMQNMTDMSNFISQLKRNDNTSLIEAINTGFDVITTNCGYDIPSLMERANILCEQVANTVESEMLSGTSKSEMSPKMQNKFIQLIEPIILKITDYYEDPEVNEEITPMLLMWTLKEAKQFDGKLLNDDMSAINKEFINYLHKSVNVNNKSIPLIYLTATKLADRVRGKSKYFEGKPTTSQEVDVDTSRLVSSLIDELDSINKWAIDNPAFKTTEILDKKWIQYFKLIWDNPDIRGTELIKLMPELPYNIKGKGKAPTIHGEAVKRAGKKLINILSKHPRWKNKIGTLRSAIAELSKA